MKSILISIRPQWVEKIAKGEKTIEVRKSAPKETPFKVYIYATRPKKFYKCGAISTSDELLWLANGKFEMGDGFKFWADGDDYKCLNGKVIGEFVCNNVDEYTFSHYEAEYRVTHVEQKAMCLNHPELIRYGVGKTLYGLHISDLKIYDKPKKLSEFVSVHEKDFCDECGVAWESWNGDYHCTQKYCDGYHISRPPQNYIYVKEYENEQTKID